MESQQFIDKMTTVITQIFEDFKSIFINSPHHECYSENNCYNYKLFLHTKATDWNNYKKRTTLVFHFRIDSQAKKLIIEANNSDYDLELALLRVGIIETDIYDPWDEEDNPGIFFTGF